MRPKMPLYIGITFFCVAAILGVAFMFFRLDKVKTEEEESERFYERYYVMICDDSL